MDLEAVKAVVNATNNSTLTRVVNGTETFEGGLTEKET
jgi:hypothetical protein